MVNGVAAPSPADGTETMQISLLVKEGKILFAESNSDFVDALARVLQQPLGAVVGCVDGGQEKKTLSKLQDSLVHIRDPIFVNGKLQKAKEIEKPMDIGSMLAGSAPAPVVPIEVTPQFASGIGMQVIPSTKDGRTGFQVTPGPNGSFQTVTFTPSEECSEFLITWQHTVGSDYMIGIAPGADGQLQTKLNVNGGIYNKHWGVHAYISSNIMHCVYYGGTQIAGNSVIGGNPLPQLEGGKEYSMRVQMNGGGQPVMEFCDTASKQWKSIQGQGFSIPTHKCIPFLHVYPPNTTALHVTEITFGDPSAEAAVPKPIFHPVARFLIANDLEICESSSLKALEIMQKCEVNDAKALKVHAVSFGASELQRLIGRALCGETDVLDYALKGCLGGLGRPASPASSVGSPSTMRSVEIVGMDKF